MVSTGWIAAAVMMPPMSFALIAAKVYVSAAAFSSASASLATSGTDFAPLPALVSAPW